MAKPTKYPRWATNDVVDPTSSQNNVVEPGESKKDLGFGPSGEFPLRQHFNWLFRLIHNWIKWFDEQINYRTGIFEVTVVNSNPTVNFNIRYERFGDVVTLIFPNVSCNLPGPSTVFELNPVTSYPPEVLPPTGITNAITTPILATQFGEERVCSLTIKTTFNEWLIGWPGDNGDLSNSAWGNGSTEIGRGSVTYSVFNIENAQ